MHDDDVNNYRHRFGRYAAPATTSCGLSDRSLLPPPTYADVIPTITVIPARAKIAERRKKTQIRECSLCHELRSLLQFPE